MKKRLFVALDISSEAREAAASHVEKISRRFPGVPIKWERPEKFHITVRYLGMTDDELLRSVIDIVDRNAAATQPFDVELAGTGAFPNASRPRVFWLGISQPSGDMTELARRIELHSRELGFEPENREFKPHLTLARIRDPRIASEVGRAHADAEFGPIHFTCAELVLYESHLGKPGSRYEKVHTARFVS